MTPMTLPRSLIREAIDVNRSRVRRAALFAALLLVAAVPCSRAWSQGHADLPYGASDSTGMSTAEGFEADRAPTRVSIIDLVGKFVLVLGLGWGVMRAVRWWQETRGGASPGGGPAGRQMRVQETLSLGSDGRLHLLSVEGRLLLLAGGPEGLRQLADLTPTTDDDVPSVYRSRRTRTDGAVDELNIVRASVGHQPVRADLTRDAEDWRARREQLLRELQES